MEQRLKISGRISIFLGIILFLWLIFDLIVFEKLRPKVTQFETLGRIEDFIIYIYIGFLISIVFHLISFLYLFFQFQHLKKITTLTLITWLVGIISFIGITGDFASILDIGTQYRHRLSTDQEWAYLYLSLIFHAGYIVLFYVSFIKTIRDIKTLDQKETVLRDEVFFQIAQYTGIVCGFIGICFTFLLIVLNVPAHLMKKLIPFYYPFIIFPYCLILIYWILLKRKEKLADWYDEMQWWNITRASLTTLLLSIPGMAILFIIHYFTPEKTTSLIWFPFYLFLILFLFSGSIRLYNPEEQ